MINMNGRHNEYWTASPLRPKSGSNTLLHCVFSFCHLLLRPKSLCLRILAKMGILMHVRVLVSIPRYYILVSYRSQNYGIDPSLVNSHCPLESLTFVENESLLKSLLLQIIHTICCVPPLQQTKG